MMVLGHSSVSFRALSRAAIWPPQLGGVDHVKAGVGSQQGVHLAVDAAQAVVVDLHGNVQAVILLAQVDEDVGLVLLSLFGRCRPRQP